MENTETQEMYLVTIDKLSRQQGTVRSIDIAVERGFSKSTVHAALKNLEGMGLINFVPGNITLTDVGKDKVRSLEEKHSLVVRALSLLGASDELAEQEACRMEHVISDEVYMLLRKHIDFGEQMASIMAQKKND